MNCSNAEISYGTARKRVNESKFSLNLVFWTVILMAKSDHAAHQLIARPFSRTLTNDLAREVSLVTRKCRDHLGKMSPYG